MWSSSVSEAFLKKCGMPAGMNEVSPTPTGYCSPSIWADRGSAHDHHRLVAVVEVLGNRRPGRERGDAVEEVLGADLAGHHGQGAGTTHAGAGVISEGRRIAAVRPSRSWADFSATAASVMMIHLILRSRGFGLFGGGCVRLRLVHGPPGADVDELADTRRRPVRGRSRCAWCRRTASGHQRRRGS